METCQFRLRIEKSLFISNIIPPYLDDREYIKMFTRSRADSRELIFGYIKEEENNINTKLDQRVIL